MRKTYKQLTDADKQAIAVQFHLQTLEWLSKKLNVSKSTIQLVVTEFFKKKRIDVTGLGVVEIMEKYNVTMGKAITLQMKFDKPLGGSIYFGQTKEAIYSSEQDMIIPEYNFNGLSESEKIIYETL
jgi:mRNA deadenylase 3'-5' endonuclease subunit Ccr4